VRLALLFLFITITGCRAWREDVQIKNSQECIAKKCKDHEVTEHEECVTTCKRRFDYK
jgi:hypothetical protein